MIITLIVSSTLIIITLASIVIILLFRYQQRNQVYTANIKTLQLEYDKNILQVSVEVQENTFKHISREIHDNIGLSLTLAKLNLNLLSEAVKGEQQNKIINAKEVLSSAIDSLSSLSKGLNAEIICEIGLLEFIRVEIGRIANSSDLSLHFEVGGNPVYMEAEKELVIARIIQECLNNILKHSKADTANLLLYYSEDRLKITITDNGIGIKSVDPSPKTSGIRNLHSRTKLIGGQLEIFSKENIGTTVNISIPINNNERGN
jgi:two-component system, NarL family, sensor kinase